MTDKETIKTMWKANSDGAGLCYIENGKVVIKKGFMCIADLLDAIDSIDNIEDRSLIVHFRISTQGGIRKDCTHPFPLSKDMSDLRQLEFESDWGIAHNGIIDMCCEYSYGYGKTKKIDYSDTMKFISEYLTLIIKDKAFKEDADTLELIEKMLGSKLAVMDNDGEITMIGKFYEEEDGFFSNTSYIPYTYKPYTAYSTAWDDDDSYYDGFDETKPTKSYTLEEWEQLFDECDEISCSKKIEDISDEEAEKWDYCITPEDEKALRSITETDVDLTEAESLEEWVKAEAELCYDWDKDVFKFSKDYCPLDAVGTIVYCDKCINFESCYRK